jgi:hypothetical protein
MSEQTYYFVYADSQFGPQREGGFETRAEAEALQARMARRGRRNTWITLETLYAPQVDR